MSLLSIDDITEAIIRQPFFNTDTNGSNTLAILANTINRHNGLLLVWFVVHNGQVRGYKTLVEPLSMSIAANSIMELMVSVLQTHDEAQIPAIFARSHIYPLPAGELWDLIATKDRPKYEYEYLKAIPGIGLEQRRRIPDAVHSRVRSR